MIRLEKLMRTKQFSCDSDRRMAKSWVPPPFFLDFCLNFCRDADLQEQDHFPRLAACRRRFFFGPNSVSLGKGPFSSAGGLPQALFFGQKWRFRWKNDVFAFYKGCQQSYREPFINFLALLGHSQRKSWFYHFLQKIFKKDIFLEMFIFH